MIETSKKGTGCRWTENKRKKSSQCPSPHRKQSRLDKHSRGRRRVKENKKFFSRRPEKIVVKRMTGGIGLEKDVGVIRTRPRIFEG